MLTCSRISIQKPLWFALVQNTAAKMIVVLAVCVALVATASAEDPDSDKPVSFVNDVMPLLTKAGCNSGACHAKAGNGQNGFELSLLGFEPTEDYEHLTREGRARRLFPAAPDRSLLLQKAAAIVPHGGGVRLKVDSNGYAVLRRWVQQGTPYRSESDPDLVSIKIQPQRATLAPSETLQLKIIAEFSDSTQRDVTALSLYESNDSAMGDVDQTGNVTAMDIPGRFAVMVRYQGKATAFTGSIPLGKEIGELPTPNNFIDELVFANLKELGIPPSDSIDDATFLRRVTLDIAGRLPSDSERDAFFNDASTGKREQLIDRLISSPDYADYFANKWTTLLKNRRDAKSDITSNFAFHAWIRDSLLENKPYDHLVRELLAATGTVIANPAVAWYKRVKEPNEQLEDVAQLFLGVRLQCAQCHHHPFEKWSQDDYYGLAAFFSQIGRKSAGLAGEDLIFHQRGFAGSKNIKSGETIRPIALGDSVGEIPQDEDPRLRLATWMSSPENSFFAKAVVNRYWKHFFKRGLIEPEDDIRDTNPPTNPELLAAIEKHFVESKFDLKELVRVITRSKAYQLSAMPNEHNLVDRQNYSRFYPRRMQAEVMLDAIDQVTGAKTSFANLPDGTRAVALPDNSYNKASPFLKVFGRPESASVCECERVTSASLAQSLHLINANDIKSKLRGLRSVELEKQEVTAQQKVSQLYLAAFSREPSEKELATAIAYLGESRVDKNGKPMSEFAATRDNLHDLIWALINTKEFLFNH